MVTLNTNYGLSKISIIALIYSQLFFSLPPVAVTTFVSSQGAEKNKFCYYENDTDHTYLS